MPRHLPCSGSHVHAAQLVATTVVKRDTLVRYSEVGQVPAIRCIVFAIPSPCLRQLVIRDLRCVLRKALDAGALTTSTKSPSIAAAYCQPLW